MDSVSRLAVACVALLVALAGLPDATSAATPQLNSTTSLDQEQMAVAQLANGSVVFAWEDQSLAEGRIFFRRLDASLTTSLTGEQRVDLAPVPPLERSQPAVCALSGGGFVVVYTAVGVDLGGPGVVFRRYNAADQPLDASEVRANDLWQVGPQSRPQVAPLGNGGFVICWVGPGPGGGAGQDVFFRRFSSSGTPLEPGEVTLNQLGADAVVIGDQGCPRIAPLPGGGFVVVYEDRATGDIYGVRLASDGLAQPAPGEPAGNVQFLVPGATTYEQSRPAVAGLASGGFVVAYNTETNGTAASRRVFARAFNAAGIGGIELQAGAHNARWQDARVAGLTGGDFVVTWQARDPDPTTNGWSIYKQRFSAAGSPLEFAWRIHTSAPGRRDTPCIAALADGGYVIGWQSFGEDTSGYGVYARRFAPSLPVPGVLTIVRQPGNGNVAIRFSGQADHDHELQSSSNLLTWASVLVTNPPGGAFQYLQPSTPPNRQFRVQTR